VVLLKLSSALLLALAPTPSRFEIPSSAIELSRSARPGAYVEASGPRAALLGSEDGVFEAWIHPFKILHGLRISVKLPETLSEIPLAPWARRVVVRPESTTLTFSHMAFTLHLTVFVPTDLPAAVMLLDLNSSRPLTLYLDFATDLMPMWPGGMGGQFSVWQEEKRAFLITESRRKYAAYLGSPLAVAGSSLPAHNLPDAPTRMVLELTPQQAAESFLPVIVAGSVEGLESGRAPSRAWEVYEQVLAETESLYRQTRDRYRASRAARLQIVTPDPEINLAAEWAAAALEKLRVCNPALGCGLVAGLGRSGLSLRPGFGWFFGGDSFINSLALSSLGEFDLVREALELVRRNQRADGKMMHELSQSGALVPWFQEYPYPYYHADTTPYYLVALHDYVLASGDLAYLESSWESVEKAYRYCLTTDTDGDGLMENSSAGLGAVETGKLLGDLHTDIYLGAVWARGLEALQELARIRKDAALAQEVAERAARARRSLDERFWDEAHQRHVFALTGGGASKSAEATVWPAVGIALGVLERIEGELDLLASAELASDWGVRMLSEKSAAYDPLSYNNGSVWPFLTGFASWASYQGRRPQAGFQMLAQNARLTRLDGLGYHPELLSGELHQVVETAVPHQGFSSFGVIAPLARGLAGLTVDAISGVVRFAPQIPASWDRLELRNVKLRESRWTFLLTRGEGRLQLRLEGDGGGGGGHRLRFAPALPPGTREVRARVNGKASPVRLTQSGSDVRAELETDVAATPVVVELTFEAGPEVEIPFEESPVGGGGRSLKLVRTIPGRSSFKLVLEGKGGEGYRFFVHRPPATLRASGAEREPNSGSRAAAFRVRYEGRGYQRSEIVLSW
jgi:glycogen debranching enzyme